MKVHYLKNLLEVCIVFNKKMYFCKFRSASTVTENIDINNDIINDIDERDHAKFKFIEARTSSSRAHRERTLFMMVCCITLTFFICHLPR